MKIEIIQLGGGINLESPHLSIKNGQVLEAENVEPRLSGGYSRVLGYERCSGQLKPSDAAWYLLQVDDGSSVSLGAITGSISGATATVVDKDSNDICITNLVGSFVPNDLIPTATVTVSEVLEGQTSPSLSNQWYLAAQNYYRGLINPVSGVGAILGVWSYNNTHYAFRSDGSNVIMHKSTITGWQPVQLYKTLKFTAGVGTIEVGDTLTGATSAASGLVKNVILQSGNFGSNAVGYVVIDVTSGAFQSAESLQISAITQATSSSASEDIALALGANNYKFVTYNFKGNDGSKKMYGADSVNNGFEFDGDVYTPIFTGMAIDKPMLVSAHKKHLFLTFDGGSLQHSALGDPLVWTPLLGAAELAVGNNIRSIQAISGDTLLISTDEDIQALYGSSSLDWKLSLITTNTGGIGDTIGTIGSPFVLTRNGLTRVDATQAYGNFVSSTVSRLIKPLLDDLVKRKTLIGSLVIRSKNQYRLYFNDGFGLIMHYDALFGQGSLPEFTVFNYTHNPSSICNVITDDSEEITLFGDDQGNVYEEFTCDSFDGEEIEWVIRMPFSHLKSPSLRKSFRRYELELDTDGSLGVRISYEFSYGQLHTAQSRISTIEAIGDGGYWGSDDWSDYNWTTEEVGQFIQSMEGTGHNVSMLFYGKSASDSKFTLHNITYHYLPRRINRG